MGPNVEIIWDVTPHTPLNCIIHTLPSVKMSTDSLCHTLPFGLFLRFRKETVKKGERRKQIIT